MVDRLWQLLEAEFIARQNRQPQIKIRLKVGTWKPPPTPPPKKSFCYCCWTKLFKGTDGRCKWFARCYEEARSSAVGRKGRETREAVGGGIKSPVCCFWRTRRLERGGHAAGPTRSPAQLKWKKKTTINLLLLCKRILEQWFWSTGLASEEPTCH